MESGVRDGKRRLVKVEVPEKLEEEVAEEEVEVKVGEGQGVREREREGSIPKIK